MTLTFGSLFSGIGGIDLGLERAGMKCLWQVECDTYARKVLSKHWPLVPCYEDVRGVRGEFVPHVDVLAGGFPCQDISQAGRRVGIEGARSGLWVEFFRLIRELRPRYVLVENVAALLVRGIGRVLGDLASIGFDAEWSVLPACALGAPHERERLFIVANAHGFHGRPWLGFQHEHHRQGQIQGCGHRASRRNWLATEPRHHRMANGVSSRMDRHRIRCLGNAVVPQVAEYVGRLIVAHAAGALQGVRNG